MNDNSVDKRLRVVEGDLRSLESRDKERWRMQFANNQKCEARMEDLEKCVSEFRTTIKVNNARLTMIFFIVQIAVSGLLIVVLDRLMQ